MFAVYIDNIKDYNLNIAKQDLSNDILYKCENYKIEEKRNQSIIGYYLLKKYLKEDYNIELKNLKVNEYGKSYIDEIYFNISHSKNMIAIIICDKPCGIDIEVSDKRNLRLARKILNQNEIELIKDYNDEDKLDYIMKKWVSIESYSKMNGNNFDLNLDVEINAVTVTHILEKDIYYLSKCIKKCEI